MTDIDLLNGADAPPVDVLAPIFKLPAHLSEHPVYAPIYAEMIARLTADAAGIQMSTIQSLLIERIATVYVTIRYCEDEPGRWVGVNTEDQTRKYWLALTHEFYTILAQGEQLRREKLLEEIESMIIAGLDIVTDPDDKKKQRSYYETKLADLGL